jgi:hypothetical protein
MADAPEGRDGERLRLGLDAPGSPASDPEPLTEPAGAAPPLRLPPTRAAQVDPRLLAAWREWLAALATDAEAAMAAAHVYGELAPDGRDAWLEALAEDAPNLGVPLVALYGPLLSVETDVARRDRMETALSSDLLSLQGARVLRALRGVALDGARLVALVRGVYLSFVQVLWCRFVPDAGFVWVRHDPLLRDHDAPHDGASLEGTRLETTPMKPVIEELAHAILAHRRRGAELSTALRPFADVFDAHVDPLD